MAKSNGQEAPTVVDQDPAIQAMRIKSLELGIQKLTDVYKANLQELQRAFSMSDQHIFVQQRVSNDMLSRRIRVTPLVGQDQEFLDSNPPWEVEREHVWLRGLDSQIDFQWYHKQFYEASQLDIFLRWLSILALLKKGQPATEENVSYFGGDVDGQSP